MPVTQRDAANQGRVATIRAAVFEPFHDAFQHAGVGRCIGTFVNNREGAQGNPAIQPLKVFQNL